MLEVEGGQGLSQAAQADLAELLGDRLSTSDSVLDLHARDESAHAPRAPDAVAFPRDTAEVAATMRVCARHGVPVIPWGVGSSLEGHVLPVAGGLTVDLAELHAVRSVSAEDLDCEVEAGVRRLELERTLGERGLFFAVDPGADATLGGMAATAATGTRTLRYGGMRENVLGLEVVLADGSVVHTGSRARKSSAGYDLTRLFLGSEGTLGIITALRLRLHGIPEHIAAARCTFSDVEQVVATVIEAVQLGIPLARAELVDAATVRAVNVHEETEDAEVPTLCLEFHGPEGTVNEQIAAVRELADAHGGGEFQWAETTDERNRLWRARHNAYFAVLASRPGSRIWTTDVCVPVSALAACIAETQADARDLPFAAPVLGHVADGNFHCALPLDPDSESEHAQAEAFVDRLVARALAAGGTCTGEHGIGMGKREHLREQAGETGIATMRALKDALDPAGLLNPGKVLPDR